MCGIVACRVRDHAAPVLLSALRNLEYRGYDSVGIAVSTEIGTLARIRTVHRIDDLEHRVNDWNGPRLGNVGIGHTRWATHGAVDEANAHPHCDCTGRISLVHNGIIENCDELRATLTTSGHQFSSAVDSEVVCHLIEARLAESSDLFDAVQTAVTQLEGSWALAVLEESTGRLVAAAHHSPLLLAHNDAGTFVTSDPAAVSEWASEFHILRDGDVVEAGETLRWRNSGLMIDPPTPVDFARTHSPAELRGHSDFMDQEIDEQPVLAAKLIDELGPAIANGRLWDELGLPPFDALQIIACGTSMHAGRVIAQTLGRLAAVPTTLTLGSEVAYDVVLPRTLRLAISQSGETADVLRALDHPVPTEVRTLALTNNPHSTLSRRADAVLAYSAGPEIGVAATKTFVAQVIVGVCAVLSALVSSGRLSVTATLELVEQLRRLPVQLTTALEISRRVVPAIAHDLSTASGFLFLGRGSALPYAAEGALKLKELSYRWAEHYPAGELKHGPLALIEPGTPVVAVENGDPRLRANISEVRARGARVVTVGYDGSTIPVLTGEPTPWGPLEAVVPLQILARAVALELGRDVDKPRNLAKSVTVE
ncbi:glutamine--fructose-6-phosphate transaminase (isomerizing) [Rhodococcus sp. MS16]|uniref:glutamine--fructose-6-phosphate transaminase (isomerizing) n=1 Tax=Rhodococcus sp. MS16 TaxID=2579941 RepID=UPI001562D062|nr:glutamine--fructose-6-phosphate transaminase (isomerizing) [Rhodococcus sp. MS16]NRI65450.1 glutamine--fructose-6-phosphate transaminase (isomerizing) [Rhodococcus sp. MS16]